MPGMRLNRRNTRVLIFVLAVVLSVWVIFRAVWELKSDDLNHPVDDVERHPKTKGTAIVVMPSPPSVSGPMTRIDRLKAIQDTWGRDLLLGNGRQQSSLVYVMDEDDPQLDQGIELWGANMLVLGEAQRGKASSRVGSGKEEQGPRSPVLVIIDGSDGDERLRYVLSEVARMYNPDFLFFCNEHTFVIVENLECFVRDLDPAKAVYLGNRFKKDTHQAQDEAMLNSGAAGFVLSRASLRLLRKAWGDTEPALVGHHGVGETRPGCTARSAFERDNPGVVLARCLKMLGVDAEDTSDEQGGQRFNAYGPVRLAHGNIDDWYKKVHASPPGMWASGPACCARNTVTFHYVGPAEARAMHRILHNRYRYRLAGYSKAFETWPHTSEEVGPYSATPRGRNDPVFHLLLEKISLCKVR